MKRSSLPILCGLIPGLLLSGGACTLSEIRAVPPEGREPLQMSESPAVSYDAGDDEEDPDGDEEPRPIEDDADAGDTGEPDAGEPPCDDPLSCLEVPADCVGESFEGHAYLFCSAGQHWQPARARCQALGLDLAVVETDAENSFLASHLTTTSWIGAHDRDVEGSFRWIEPGAGEAGQAVAFSQWAFATPDNCGLFGQQDCVRIAANGTWDDSACDGGCLEDTFAFVCESY